MAENNITRHFFNGFIRLHILHHAAKEAIYGAEITQEMVRHGYRLSQGTLYPTLHQLEDLGYVESRHDVVNGRRRKYYRATAAGRKVLAEARHKLVELVGEVIEQQDDAFTEIHRRHHGRTPGKNSKPRGKRKTSRPSQHRRKAGPR
jgi:DNA-binding PadR family transcriptional regulator